DFHELAPTRKEMLADVYALAAELYAARGQIEFALEMWERSRPPDDVTNDSRASQEWLRLPRATDALIAEYQRKWVRRHIADPVAVEAAAPRPAADGKIHIGYHCSFMSTDTIRYMMRDVLRAHDRSKFVIHGYTAVSVAEDIRSGFDEVHD